jgi:hypothetical protein
MPISIISKDNFFEEDVFTRKHQIRYRIISDNKNNISYWSPIFSISSGFDFVTSGNLIVDGSSDYRVLVWNAVSIEKDLRVIGELPYYDLWVRWGTKDSDGEWSYYQRVFGTSINLVKPETPSGIDVISVEIYRPMRPTSYRNALYDIEQSDLAGKVDLSNDTIEISLVNVFETGVPVRYTSSNTIGGLTSNTLYFVNMISKNTFSLHTTKAEAVSNTNRISLTSRNDAIGYFRWEDYPVCDFLVYSEYNVSPA